MNQHILGMLECTFSLDGPAQTHGNYELYFPSLRKHAYSNKLKKLPPKNENFQIKNYDIFHISAQNIDCGYSLELPVEAVLTSTHNLCF